MWPRCYLPSAKTVLLPGPRGSVAHLSRHVNRCYPLGFLCNAANGGPRASLRCGGAFRYGANVAWTAFTANRTVNPAKEAVILFPPAILRLQNGRFWIVLTGLCVATLAYRPRKRTPVDTRSDVGWGAKCEVRIGLQPRKRGPMLLGPRFRGDDDGLWHLLHHAGQRRGSRGTAGRGGADGLWRASNGATATDPAAIPDARAQAAP